MTVKIIRYTILGLALLAVVVYLNGVRKILNDERSSITTEVPGVEVEKAPATKAPPSSSGQTITLEPFIPSFVSNALAFKKDYPVLTLGKQNTIVFRDVVTTTSMGKLESQLIEMSHKLPVSSPIYLVLDTPGGDIEAGNQFIDTAKAIPQEVKTITLFSASMGFHIVQNLGERLITPSGTLMSHRAAISGLAGHIPGEAVVRLNKILTEVNEMDKRVSKRVGMPYKDYQALVRDEYWVSGEDALQDHMADKIIFIACAPDLNGTYKQNMSTLFGTLTVEWSNCPAIGAPVSDDSQKLLSQINQPTQRDEMFKFLNTFFNNKEQFIREYIFNNSYRKYIY